MNSCYILPCKYPAGCPVDLAILTPHLLPGETMQGFLTVSYILHQTSLEAFNELTLTQVSLKQLL